MPNSPCITELCALKLCVEAALEVYLVMFSNKALVDHFVVWNLLWLSVYNHFLAVSHPVFFFTFQVSLIV